MSWRCSDIQALTKQCSTSNLSSATCKSEDEMVSLCLVLRRDTIYGALGFMMPLGVLCFLRRQGLDKRYGKQFIFYAAELLWCAMLSLSKVTLVFKLCLCFPTNISRIFFFLQGQLAFSKSHIYQLTLVARSELLWCPNFGPFSVLVGLQSNLKNGHFWTLLGVPKAL